MKAFKVVTSVLMFGGAIALAATAASAHDEGAGHEGHDHSVAKHDHAAAAGGIVAEVGHYDAELVATDGQMRLLLKDHDGKDAASEGYKASVLVMVGSERHGPFDLAPAGGNRLEGKGVALKAGSKAIVTLTDKGGKAVQGRFEMK